MNEVSWVSSVSTKSIVFLIPRSPLTSGGVVAGPFVRKGIGGGGGGGGAATGVCCFGGEDCFTTGTWGANGSSWATGSGVAMWECGLLDRDWLDCRTTWAGIPFGGDIVASGGGGGGGRLSRPDEILRLL